MPNYISEIELQPSGTVAKIKDEAAQLSITDLYNQIGAIDTAHVYNQSTPDSGLTTNIGLKEGTYNITTDTTINAQLVVPKGAILNVAAGVTLTINGTITAGRYQIFDGSGSIVVDNTKQSVGYPEWFGDDIAKCYSVFNHIELGARDYVVNGDLHLVRNNSTITGVNYGTYTGASNQPSRLIFTTGRLIIGRYDTQTINDYSLGICVKNVVINYSGNLEAVSVYGCLRFIMEDCYIIITTLNGAGRGIHLMQAIGSFFHRCYVQVVNNTGTFWGYDIDNTGSNMNASVWLTECSFGDTGTPTGRSYGFTLHGARVSDIYLDKCEVAVANIGMSIIGLSDANSVDILINQCDFDSIKENSILIYNCSAGAINFSNCYAAPQGSSEYSIFSIYESTINIIVNGMQLINTAAAQIGIQAVNCVPRLIGDFTIRNSSNPVLIADTSHTALRYFNNNALVTV